MTSRMYDLDVVGYDSGVNKLHLFDLESVDESLVKEGITFDKEAVTKTSRCFYTRMILMKREICCVSTSSISW